MPIPATLMAASLLGFVLLVLAWRCVAMRGQLAKLEEAGDEAGEARAAAEAELAHRGRVMANFTEYTPFLLIQLGALELAGTATGVAFLLAGLIVLARVMHAWGYGRSSGRSAGRYWGTLLSWLLIAGQSLLGLYCLLIA
ncbi:MAG: MAPEG family protein [Alphaproteobacteria bacterium]|nr:MAG: MAPEG family protein [Alphaproteobacteria bacterium]